MTWFTIAKQKSGAIWRATTSFHTHSSRSASALERVPKLTVPGLSVLAVGGGGGIMSIGKPNLYQFARSAIRNTTTASPSGTKSQITQYDLASAPGSNI